MSMLSEIYAHTTQLTTTVENNILVSFELENVQQKKKSYTLYWEIKCFL